MKNLLPRVAFWLIPEQSACACLDSLIQALAKRHATVAFVPHVTIYSCFRSSHQSEVATAERLARNFQEVSLTVDTLTGGEKLTQALYLTFKNNKEIRRLNELLVAHIFNSSDYELHPHLSLLYQNLKTKERKALIEDIKLDIKSILFNELRVVAIPEQLKSIDDLKGWQTLLSCRLAPGENLDTL